MEPTDAVTLYFDIAKHDRRGQPSSVPVTPDTVYASTQTVGEWTREPSEWRDHFKRLFLDPIRVYKLVLTGASALAFVLMASVVMRILYFTLIVKNPSLPENRARAAFMFAALYVIIGAVLAASAVAFFVARGATEWSVAK